MPDRKTPAPNLLDRLNALLCATEAASNGQSSACQVLQDAITVIEEQAKDIDQLQAKDQAETQLQRARDLLQGLLDACDRIWFCVPGEQDDAAYDAACAFLGRGNGRLSATKVPSAEGRTNA